MTDEQISAIALPLLRERFKSSGLADASVSSEEDFDGSSVIRVTAYFEEPNVSTSDIIDVLHRIRTELLRKGEHRFVLFSERYVTDNLAEEDVE